MNPFIGNAQRFDRVQRAVMRTIIHKTEFQLCLSVQRTQGFEDSLVKKSYAAFFIVAWYDE